MIDPEIAAARARQAQVAAPFDITKLPIAEGRARSDAMAMFFNDGSPEVEQVETFSIAGQAGPIRARLYRPKGAARALLYLHGGGWVTCNIDTHDSVMRRLALAADAVLLGIDFRLAPEHPFPAPLDDVIAGWRWFVANVRALGVSATQLGVAGDSAGANLALALSIAERDAGRAIPNAAALIYGAYAPRFTTPSYAAKGDGRYGLTTERMRWYWRQFIGGDLLHAPSLAAPLNEDLRNLAPHYLALAEHDPLADDTRALAARFAGAGVECALDEWLGAVHGFLQMGRDVALARKAIAKAGDFLKRRL